MWQSGFFFVLQGRTWRGLLLFHRKCRNMWHRDGLLIGSVASECSRWGVPSLSLGLHVNPINVRKCHEEILPLHWVGHHLCHELRIERSLHWRAKHQRTRDLAIGRSHRRLARWRTRHVRANIMLRIGRMLIKSGFDGMSARGIGCMRRGSSRGVQRCCKICSILRSRSRLHRWSLTHVPRRQGWSMERLTTKSSAKEDLLAGRLSQHPTDHCLGWRSRPNCLFQAVSDLLQYIYQSN